MQQAVFTGNSNLSALAEHTMNTGHEVDWPGAMVLDSCQAFYQRSYLELWYIHKEQAPLNRERGPLPSVYQALLNSQ